MKIKINFDVYDVENKHINLGLVKPTDLKNNKRVIMPDPLSTDIENELTVIGTIFEECIEHKELTVPILNGRCLPAVEIITSESFYNYKAKYEKDDTQLLQINYSSEEQEILESICMNTFNVMGCNGWARIDLLQDFEGTFYVLEINTVPGMTSHSLFPASAKSAGLDYKSLIQEIINES